VLARAGKGDRRLRPSSPGASPEELTISAAATTSRGSSAADGQSSAWHDRRLDFKLFTRSDRIGRAMRGKSVANGG
jgi:hypothetical protein